MRKKYVNNTYMLFEYLNFNISLVFFFNFIIIFNSKFKFNAGKIKSLIFLDIISVFFKYIHILKFFGEYLRVY